MRHKQLSNTNILEPHFDYNINAAMSQPLRGHRMSLRLTTCRPPKHNKTHRETGSEGGVPLVDNIPAQLAEAIAFHGHLCPGLVIGYRAALIALRELGVQHAQDEEIVAICETDACGVDAIQVLTGCTLGKGNLILRDWGKQVFSFGRRQDGRLLRIALRYQPKQEVPDQTAEEHRAARVEHLLRAPDEELYDIRWVEAPLPEPARIFKSVRCSQCGEAVMEARARLREGQPVCLSCYGPEYRRFVG
jgi:formylmethanofuran dehydrogenase subunit E